MLKEFKEFAMKGNVVDLAVGLVIGAAFGAIVNSLVTDIITPIIGIITGGIDFGNRYILLRDGNPAGPYLTVAAAKQAGAVTLNIGNLISLVINFVLVAFALFLVVKAMNRLRRAQIETPVPPPAPTREEVLLTEIRDLLRTGRPV